MPNKMSPQDRQKAENNIKQIIEQQLSKTFNSTKEMLEYINMNRVRIDWKSIDQTLGFISYHKKAFSQKLMKETIASNLFDPWPQDILLNIELRIKQLIMSNAVLQQMNEKEYIQARKQIMKVVEQELQLKQKPHSFKKVQDMMRYKIDSLAKHQVLQDESESSEEEVAVPTLLDQLQKLCDTQAKAQTTQVNQNTSQKEPIRVTFNNYIASVENGFVPPAKIPQISTQNIPPVSKIPYIKIEVKQEEPKPITLNQNYFFAHLRQDDAK
ncbi:Hypothetical_protein [Hexamita inflata]|uniref:Hypothetical_protein n=1 Tax=Hexamita inflata TaxID=28002 RepID=A0AA86P2F8_9EUKA|nr:Hypothetical protein HINF_LOCUS17200 [Hexamita inflata]